MLKKARILVVEDSEADQIIIQRAFDKGKINCHLHMCENGEVALSFLRETLAAVDEALPDLILMDINMPVMDGKRTLEHIREDVQLKHLPVIMLTTSSAEKDVLESYQLGVNAYLTKPLSHSDFVDAIQKLENFWLDLVTLPPQHVAP